MKNTQVSYTNSNVKIRKYKKSDCKKLSDLFYDTVHSVNAKDYTQKQLDVWAPVNINLQNWNKSLEANYAIVATIDNIIVGFGDIEGTGYLNRLYVHKDYQRQGIATRICDELEKAIDQHTYEVHASISAKSFFEKRGYKIIKKQNVEKSGVLLTNYIMRKIINKCLK